MGLVGVTEIVGQRRWVGLGLTRQSSRSLLEAIPPDHPLRAYAYILGEEPLELTRSYAAIASKLINASDVRSGCDVIDDLRNCLGHWVALGQDAAQESVRLREHLALVGRVPASGRVPVRRLRRMWAAADRATCALAARHAGVIWSLLAGAPGP